MPRLKNIAVDSTIDSNDKLLGSDVSGATKNYTIGNVTTYIQNNMTVSFKHHQNSSAISWGVADGSGGFWIVHNLDLEDYLPNVTLKMSTGVTYTNVQAMGLVTYVDKNKLRIQFAAAESGYAYIKK
jgi:hypothetical protein